MGIALTGILIALTAIAFTAWVYMAYNVEQPKYRVIVADGDCQVRDYPEVVVAEVTATGDRKSAVSSGFRTLAAYIFATERGGDRNATLAPGTQAREKIAMTAPVVQSRPNERNDDTWIIRFFMPSTHALDSLPQPTAGGVRLMTIPASRQAAIRFSGVATDVVITQSEMRLRDWLGTQRLQVSGPATYAYYNAPFTPGPMRRNEVWLELAH